MKTPEEIEKDFDLFMQSIGYTRVSEDVGKSPDFKNADYVNKHEKSIVELKVLDKEFFDEGGTIPSLNSVIIQPKDINEDGTGQYTFKISDKDYKETLEAVLKNANRQLRETTQYYWENDDEVDGFVIVVQAGLSSLDPMIIAMMTKNAMDHKFSSINGAVVCTPYFSTINPVTGNRNEVCISVTDEKSNIISQRRKSKCMELADSWLKYYEKGNFE